MTHPLEDICEFPLWGHHLIEASAGTGKTYTLAALYIRFILETAEHSPSLLPPHILVVTFTDAATAELRDRIRARLIECAHAFRQPPEHTSDKFLTELLNRYPETQKRKQCAYQLELAAQYMDDAAISTIHTFCKKTLLSYTFDSNSLPNVSVNTDEATLWEHVTQDYWRCQIEPLSDTEFTFVRKTFKSPQDLAQTLPSLKAFPTQAPPHHQQPALKSVLESLQQHFSQLRSLWCNETELQKFIEQIKEARKNGHEFNKTHCESLQNTMKDWSEKNDFSAPDLKTMWEKFLPQSDSTHKNLYAKSLEKFPNESRSPMWEALSTLQKQTLIDPFHQLWEHAIEWCRHRIAQEKKQRAEISFDDMIDQLHAALTQHHNHERLAEQLRSRYPVALIDEFQDTDAKQYAIFKSIYSSPDTNTATLPRHALIMIGDPKQAIYKFRGADLNTYLSAKKNISTVYTLNTNYRSSPSLIHAINKLFTYAPPKHSTIFGNDDIPFEPVKAPEQKEYVQSKYFSAAVDFHFIDGMHPNEDYLATAAHAAAAHIATLLNAPEDTTFTDKKNNTRTLKPNDIAILVRDAKEANEAKHALQEFGIRSVYLSEKNNSLLTSPEYQDVMDWLTAIAQPNDENLLRCALATATLNWPYSKIERLTRDELFREEMLLRFQNYRKYWQRYGVLAMLQRFIFDENLPQFLLTHSDPSDPRSGERKLTNILHLAELAQTEAIHVRGEFALIQRLKYLAQHHSKTHLIRLESENDLVRITTIHKSKGLEYPLVFLPFVCRRKKPSQQTPFIWHDANHEPQLCIKSSIESEAKQHNQKDNEQEAMRLLYVALTRARHYLWLGMATVGQKNSKVNTTQTSIEKLLGIVPAQEKSNHNTEQTSTEKQNAPSLPDTLNKLAKTNEDETNHVMFHVKHHPDTLEHNPDEKTPTQPTKPHSSVRIFKRKHIGSPWRIASYSALLPNMRTPTRSAEETLLSLDAHSTSLEDEIPHKLDVPDVDQAPPLTPNHLAASKKDLHHFHAGPQAGIFLHGILEWAARNTFQTITPDSEDMKTMLAKRCQRRTLRDWIPFFQHWLPTIVHTPLPLPNAQQPLRLAELSPERARPEMEFWLNIANPTLHVTHIDRCVQQHIWPERTRPQLAQQTLHGLFKGFIDLVFEHEDRFYVADYKSNRLGFNDNAYTISAMQDIMCEHRYELQGVLYVLALHRLIRQRRGEHYCYERDIGGFVCVFLRGLLADTPSMITIQPPYALIEQLDRYFFGSTDSAEHTS